MSHSAAPASSPTRSASHSRSSTTRTSARLPAVSPTGRKSAPRKFSRNAYIAAATSAVEPTPSIRSASALHAWAACLRSSPWCRGGNTNSAAGTHTDSAISQPNSRSPIGPGGVHAGNTNVSSVARCPAAIVSLSTPENVTNTPRTNISATDSQACGATSVPRVISTAPLSPSPAYATARFCRLPGKSARTISAKEPKMVNSGVCEPPATAKLTAAASGTIIAARTARRSASRSGSRCRIRSAARRHTEDLAISARGS